MATVQIILTSPAGSSACSVTGLLRSDTGLAPSGVSLPIALTLTSGNWVGSFVDPSSLPPFYLTTVVFTINSVVAQPATYPLYTAAEASGFWTSQQAIEQYLGGYNADVLSNLDNNQTGAVVAGFQDAINHAEAFTNSNLQQFWYPSGVTNPQFPTTSYQFQQICTYTTMSASAWLYNKRGAFLDGTNKLAGAFAAAKAEGESGIRRIIRDKIYDVPRNIGQQPELIFNPVIAPFGNSRPYPLTAGMVPGLP